MSEQIRAGPSVSDRRDDAASFTVDADGIIIDVSAGCEALLGWPREVLINTPLTRIIPERFHSRHRAGFSRFLETGEMPLEGQRPRLPARHAVIGEIEVALDLQRVRPGQPGVAIGTLEPIAKTESSEHADLTDAIQQSLGSNLPLAELLEKCVGVAAHRHGWDIASVWWIDPWLDRLRVIATWEAVPGAHGDYVAHTATQIVGRGEGMVGKVWAVGVPGFHSDIADENAPLRPISSDGLHGALFVPLSDGDQVVGVVEMLADEPRTFSAGDHDAVWVLADELGRLLADRLRREHESVQRERIQMALTAGHMGVWSYHIATGIVTWDEQIERLHGLAPGEFDGNFEAFAALVHDDDRDHVLERFRTAIAASTSFEHEFRTWTTSGHRLWLQISATPLIDAEGTLQALTGVVVETTERVESARQLTARTNEAALAADVGRALVGTEPIDRRLRATVEAVVSKIDAAFARVWTLPPGSDILELKASAGLYTHTDGAHARIKVGEYKIGRIAHERQPHLTNEVLTDPLVSDPEWARREGMVAFAGYPLIVSGVLVGVLGLFARQPLPDSTLTSLGSIADTIAIAIQQEWSLREMEALIEQTQSHAADMENAMRDRAHVAEVLQSSLLPPSLPQPAGIALGAAYRAGVEEVGGDFYDVIPLRTGWGFMIGDVCGRGPEAARLTALARHSLRTAMLLDHGPATALGALNDSMLAADNDRRFCTVVCGSLTPHGSGPSPEGGLTVELAVGGHPLPRVLRLDGTIDDAGSHGSLLGVFKEARHTNSTTILMPGESIVMFTDGVTEAATEAGEMFGVDRLDQLLADHVGTSAEDIAQAIVTAVDAFSDAANDDLAVLVIAATSS